MITCLIVVILVIILAVAPTILGRDDERVVHSGQHGYSIDVKGKTGSIESRGFGKTDVGIIKRGCRDHEQDWHGYALHHSM